MRRCKTRVLVPVTELSEPGNDVASFLGRACFDCRLFIRSRARFGCRAALLAHELRAERALGAILVVRPAPQPDPLDTGHAPARHFIHVI
ncbi:MAG: hypothetical protein ABIS67_12825, partial [Candidatus Eisenbacteria bacterium]